MAEIKKLSIVIVAYKSEKYLKSCLISIYKKLSNFTNWEIVLVNNDANEDICQLTFNFSKIKIIDHKKNVGFGAGVNLGVKNSEGEILFLLNPDTEILTENVADILTEFSKDEKIGIIGGKILNDKEKNQKWSAGFEVSLYDLLRNNLGLSRSEKIWKNSKKTTCDWVAGTSMFVRKKLFEELHGFDENFFMYFEDMDLCKRARFLGKEILYYPSFSIKHKNGKSYIDKKLQKKHYYDSMEYYFKKHCHSLSAIIIKLIRKTLAL